MKTLSALAGTAALAIAAAAVAGEMSSANYSIKWDVTDSGGGTATSTNYVITDSIGQSTAIGTSSSANYVLVAGFQAPPDFDADQVKDFMDNCTLDPNPGQLDTNMDGFGNICDADLDNDNIINFSDLGIMKDAFFSQPGDAEWNPDADLNGDDLVNFGDLGLLKFAFFGPPGPSGIAP